MIAGKRFKAALWALVVVVAAAGMATAGVGPGDGSGPIHPILDGNPVSVTGMVVTAGYYGQGIQVDTGAAVASVYGFGPLAYWDRLDVDRPTVGDTVSIDGYEITLSDGSTRIIAFNVSTDGATVELRDSETGRPLWRRTRGAVGPGSGPGRPGGGCWRQGPVGE